MKYYLGRSARVCAAACSLSIAAGCGDIDLEPAKPLGVTATPQTMPTVVDVSWSTERPSMGYVEYGPTPALGYSTPMQADATVHNARVLGLAPNTTYYYRVVTWVGNDAVAPTPNDAGASAVSTLQTGGFAAALPAFQVEGAGFDRVVVTPLVNTNTVVILDAAGTVVWAHPDQSGLGVTRARLSSDKLSVLYNTVGPAGTPTPNSAVIRVSLDGGTQTPVTIPDMGPDFVEHADGTIAALAADTRDVNGTPVRGDKIVEVVNGVATDVWSTFDCFDPATVPGEDMAQGWTNANALDYEATPNAYYVSLKSFNSIVKIDRATRMCTWVLGGTEATLTLAGGEPFRHQHQFHNQNGGARIVVMDNDGGGTNASRIVEYQLDLTANTATQTSAYAPATGVYTATLGEPTLLAGVTFVNWGAAGLLEQIDSMNQPTWRLIGAGAVFGYHDVTESLYTSSVRTPTP
ncbi:MAG TPA: aryl-sulfate sulfotransferase [Polyangiaceae bacterium]|nr:aryl-sulfate sulfotransferase [Polyangiaceae bacterium]